MTPELFTTTATAWSLFLLAGAGIAALPWTAEELRDSAGAFRALAGLVVRPLRRTVPVAAPVVVPTC